MYTAAEQLRYEGTMGATRAIVFGFSLMMAWGLSVAVHPLAGGAVVMIWVILTYFSGKGTERRPDQDAQHDKGDKR